MAPPLRGTASSSKGAIKGSKSRETDGGSAGSTGSSILSSSIAKRTELTEAAYGGDRSADRVAGRVAGRAAQQGVVVGDAHIEACWVIQR